MVAHSKREQGHLSQTMLHLLTALFKVVHDVLDLLLFILFINEINSVLSDNKSIRGLYNY
jgi:hypothetical protein